MKENVEKEGEVVEQQIQEKKKWHNLNSMVKTMDKTIAQKYIERPLLYKSKKFDIRCFMYIACTKPYLVLFNEGYVRCSLNDYNLENFNADTKMTHLTNVSVQKKHPQYKELKEQSVLPTALLAEYLVETGKLEKKEDFQDKVINKFKEIMRLLFVTVKDRLDAKFGCFELFGFDFLLDEDLNVTFIECNTNPALFTDTQTQKDHLPKLVQDTIDTALELHPVGQVEAPAQVQKFVEEKKFEKMRLPYELIYH